MQTVDFFTPIVDDAYTFGQIAAANSLSDVYAMGGRPITVLNIACFSPAAAPAEVWADMFKGAAEKVHEAGAVIVGGHSVEDDEPKFGMAVTGLVDPSRMFANTNARASDRIYLTKPIGTGIVTTAGKADAASEKEIAAAIAAMASLNREACEIGLAHDVRCATDITGFGLAGHLFNVARGSGVTIEIQASAVPLLPGVERMVREGYTTGGGDRNRAFIGEALSFADEVPDWMRLAMVDPQTSGGLALFSSTPFQGIPEIGRVVSGSARVLFV